MKFDSYMNEFRQAPKRYYEGPLWASRLLPAGSVLNQRLAFFDTQVSSLGAGFNRALGSTDTSMLEAGRVTSGLSFTANKLTWEAWGTDADRASILQFGTLDWNFLQTRIPSTVLGASESLDSSDRKVIRAMNLVDSLDIDEFTAAGATRGRTLYSQCPIILPAGTTFSVDLSFCTGAVDSLVLEKPVYFRITLHGTANSFY